MTNLITEINVFTDTGPAALNHDRQGNIKTLQIGGKTYTRVSSQALKAQSQKNLPENFPGATRTKDLGQLLRDKVKEIDKSLDRDAQIAFICRTIDGASSDRIKMQIILSPEEVNALATYAITHKDEEPKALSPVSVIDLISSEANPRVALYGRYMAGKPNYDVYSALAVSHATDVFPNPIQHDFFSLFDDVTDAPNHAAHTQYSSPILRQYSCLDVLQLRKNLGKGKDLTNRQVAANVTKETLLAFEAAIRALIYAVPETKKTTFAQNRVPFFIHISVGRDVVAYKEPLILSHPHSSDTRSLCQIAVSYYEERLAKTEAAFPSLMKKKHFVVTTETLSHLAEGRFGKDKYEGMIKAVVARIASELKKAAL